MILELVCLVINLPFFCSWIKFVSSLLKSKFHMLSVNNYWLFVLYVYIVRFLSPE